MVHQILFTSAPTTLRRGSGYGIVAETPNVPKGLSEEISRVAAYKDIYTFSDPNRDFNPINYL